MKATTSQLRALGFTCHATSNYWGEHYAIFRDGKRVTHGIATFQTARGAWADLASDPRYDLSARVVGVRS